MSVRKVNATEFDEIRKKDELSLVDFYADWCGPCKMLAPLLEEVATENEHLNIYKVNVDEEGALAQEFGVMSIPTMVLMRKGVILKKVVGSKTKNEILKLLNEPE